VEFSHVDAVAVDSAQAESGHKTRPVCQEQLVEGASHPVVVEQLRLAVTEAEVPWTEAACPGAEAVERLTPQGEVAHKDSDRLGGGELATRIGLGKVALENRVHDRERSDPHALDLELGRVHPDPATGCSTHVDKYATLDTSGGG